MDRFKELRHWNKRVRLNHMLGWPALVLAASAIGFGANTVATASNDIDPNQHREPLPAHVIQLSDDSYLIYDEADLTPNEICLGVNANGDAIEQVRRIDQLDRAVFAACGKEQEWGIPATASPTLARAATLTAQHPAWWIPSVSLMSLALIFPLIVGANELLGWRRDRRALRRQRKAEQKALAQRLPELEEKRRELVGAWARDEIDDLTFENKLDELVAQGLPRQTA